jgi:hypothetical protein
MSYWPIVLDPRFNYKKTPKDYLNDEVLLPYLDEQKPVLRSYFDGNYPVLSSTTTHSTTTSAPTTSSSRPGIINFAAYDKDQMREKLRTWSVILMPLALPHRPIPSNARKSEFPTLYRLARDIMSIPGSHYLP